MGGAAGLVLRLMPIITIFLKVGRFSALQW
nr:MAG TPA: hypothetical protein [Caudoviricetes sp.]